ncbi:hypothetical protein [Dactylosporangium sp. CS-033363]|uniref:hypothetical protein n=1 Tax=Dactylosporangium sp. CS-033363 TaxID=3239935 RepID=UPI003D8AEA5C
MIWLAVRLLRPWLLTAAALTALSTVALVAGAAAVQHSLDVLGLPGCVNPNRCYSSGGAILVMELVAAFVPSVLGLLLGIPLFAPEQGDFVHTQSVSPRAWAARKFTVAVVAGAALSSVLASVYRLLSARYTLLANDTYELLDLLHLNNVGFMVMRTVLLLTIAALLGLLGSSTLRTAVLSVCLWPFALIAMYGGPALLPLGLLGPSAPSPYSPDDDRYWTADVGFADPFAWTSAAMTVGYVLLLVLAGRAALRRRSGPNVAALRRRSGPDVSPGGSR